MTITLDAVLLGSGLRLDTATMPPLLLVLGLQLLLAYTSRQSLAASATARLAYALVLVGALMQVLGTELLLFLAGSAVAGYATLALGLSGPRALAPAHGLAAAMLLVAGDLALLELVMLLAKATPNLGYPAAARALEGLAGQPLVTFCAVLGFGSRGALLALCLPAGRRSAANLALLPGWTLLAVAAATGALRLACTTGGATECVASIARPLWWVPLLALVAWQLPRVVPSILATVQRAGKSAETLRGAVQRAQLAGVARARVLPVLLRRSEAVVRAWAVAMGVAVVLVVVFALGLLQAAQAGAAVARPTTRGLSASVSRGAGGEHRARVPDQLPRVSRSHALRPRRR